MKIHSISVLIAIPFIIVAVGSGYFVLMKELSSYLPVLIVSVIAIVAIYTLQPHIDFLYYRKHPQRLEIKDRTFLEKFSPFYNTLNDEEREIFEKRINVFIRSKSFKLVLVETLNMPEDFKIAIAIPAIQLTYRLDDYLFGKFDHYFGYQHPFPSPEIQKLHSVEIKYEDQMTVFDIEMLINSFNPQNRLFNTGLYAFSGIYQHLNINIDFNLLEDEEFWKAVYAISGFTKDFLTLATGIEPSSQFQILSSIFFSHNTQFQVILPEQYKQLSKIYNFA